MHEGSLRPRASSSNSGETPDGGSDAKTRTPVKKTYRAVVDCLVVGVPDDRFGDAVAVVFSIEENITVTTSAIKAHVRSALADDKAPRHCIQLKYVPRAVNGKADYKQTKILGLAVI